MIARSVPVLQAIAVSPAGASLSELSRTVNLPLTSCHRLLRSLENAHLVRRDTITRRYRPGGALVTLTACMSGASSIWSQVDEALVRLRDKWQECFYLSMFTNGEVVCVRTVETTDVQRLSVSVRVGHKLVAHASAGTRAIFAQLPESEWSGLLSSTGLPALTPFTKTDLSDLHDELTETRRRGFAVSDQEFDVGVLAVSVPVMGVRRPDRSVSVIGPRDRLLAAVERELISDLRATAEDIASWRP